MLALREEAPPGMELCRLYAPLFDSAAAPMFDAPGAPGEGSSSLRLLVRERCLVDASALSTA